MSLAVLLPLYLEAHNPEHNHYRAYDLTLAQDLLGDWVVMVRQGRCGQMVSASRAHVVDSLAAGQFAWCNGYCIAG